MVADIFKDRFVGVEPAWHRIGQAIEPGTTAAAAMAACKMDNWNVRLLPVDSPGLDGQGLHFIVRNEEGRLIVASETLVEKTYYPISNEEIFTRIMEIMVGQGLPVDAAGILGRLGNRAFMTFDAGSVVMPGGEAYEKFLVAIANHSGRDAVRIIPTSIRVVCRNTEEAAKRGARMMLSIHHSTAAIERFYEEAQENRTMLKLSEHYERQLEQMMTDLQEVPFDAVMFDRVVESWAAGRRSAALTRIQSDNIDRTRERMFRAWSLEVDRAEKLGQPDTTLWTAKQAISTYVQHLSRGGERLRDARAMRIAEGAAVPMMDELKQRTVGVLSDYHHWRGMRQLDDAMAWMR